jgi:outer membrane protein OmpA-like peptidoglycan-associated protein
LFAQNLVVNPGFEERTALAPARSSRPLLEEELTEWSVGWQSFQLNTPDLIIVDTSAASRAWGEPREGQVMAGLYLFHPAIDAGLPHDYHEFIQGSLRQPLQPGQTYRISMWVQENSPLGEHLLKATWGSRLTVHGRACNNLGVFFSGEPASPLEDFARSVRDFNLRPLVNFTEVIRTAGDWHLLTTTFTARGAYRHFVIGNFFTDQRTAIYPDTARAMVDAHNARPGPASQKVRRYAYYCLDEIYIGPDLGEPEGVAASLATTGAFTFRDLRFRTGSATLQAGATAELDALATYLREQPTIRILIEGHTDARGAAAANQRLSEDRARTVYDYLLAQGIPADRLGYQGLGENQPVAVNETPEGRARNRRVVCRIIR